MRWFRLNADLLDSFYAQKMPAGEFRRQVLNAAHGRPSTLSEWIRPDHGRPPYSKWKQLRAAVFARDGYMCRHCGASDLPLECDHIIAVSRGGASEIGNLQTLCRPCNRQKWAH